MDIIETSGTCPYCGESIDLLVEESELSQVYIEDCTVCCRPIQVCPYLDVNGEISTRLYHENEVPGV